MEITKTKRVYLVKLTRCANGTFVTRRFDDAQKALDYVNDCKDRVSKASIEDKFNIELISQTI